MSLRAIAIFDHTHQKIIEITFNFSEFASAFDTFILEIQLILEFHDQTGHTHFWPCSTKLFLINLWVSCTVPKFRKTNDTIKTLRQTVGHKDCQKVGCKYRPYFIGPFWLPPGVQNLPSWIWFPYVEVSLISLVISGKIFSWEFKLKETLV